MSGCVAFGQYFRWVVKELSLGASQSTTVLSVMSMTSVLQKLYCTFNLYIRCTGDVNTEAETALVPETFVFIYSVQGVYIMKKAYQGFWGTHSSINGGLLCEYLIMYVGMDADCTSLASAARTRRPNCFHTIRGSEPSLD